LLRQPCAPVRLCARALAAFPGASGCVGMAGGEILPVHDGDDEGPQDNQGGLAKVPSAKAFSPAVCPHGLARWWAWHSALWLHERQLSFQCAFCTEICTVKPAARTKAGNAEAITALFEAGFHRTHGRDKTEEELEEERGLWREGNFKRLQEEFWLAACETCAAPSLSAATAPSADAPPSLSAAAASSAAPPSP
jgi:hypothetical protein